MENTAVDFLQLDTNGSKWSSSRLGNFSMAKQAAANQWREMIDP